MPKLIEPDSEKNSLVNQSSLFRPFIIIAGIIFACFIGLQLLAAALTLLKIAVTVAVITLGSMHVMASDVYQSTRKAFNDTNLKGLSYLFNLTKEFTSDVGADLWAVTSNLLRYVQEPSGKKSMYEHTKDAIETVTEVSKGAVDHLSTVIKEVNNQSQGVNFSNGNGTNKNGKNNSNKRNNNKT